MITFATQNDLYETPREASMALIGACVRAASFLSVL